jgi:hypothetical protein
LGSRRKTSTRFNIRSAGNALLSGRIGSWQLFPILQSDSGNTGHESSKRSVSIHDGKGVLMPQCRGQASTEQAKDRFPFIRGCGPPGLAAAEMPISDFGTQIRKPRQPWQELDREVQALSRHGGIRKDMTPETVLPFFQ